MTSQDKERHDAAIQAMSKAMDRNMTESERGWQPIDTAPKDGTALLLLYVPELEGAIPQFVAGWVNEFETWGNGAIQYWHRQPTHWQPLPDPPREEACEQIDAAVEKGRNVSKNN